MHCVYASADMVVDHHSMILSGPVALGRGCARWTGEMTAQEIGQAGRVRKRTTSCPKSEWRREWKDKIALHLCWSH